MRQRVLGRGALLGRVAEELADEALGVLGDARPAGAPEGVVAPPDAGEQGRVLGPGERQLAAEEEVGLIIMIIIIVVFVLITIYYHFHYHYYHYYYMYIIYVGHDTAAPEVGLEAVAPRQHLGSHEVHRAAGLLQETALHAVAREPEVGHLQGVRVQGALGGQQGVLGLDVAVRDVPPVHERDGLQHLPHHERGVQLCEVPCPQHEVHQRAAGAELHDQVNALRVLERVEEPYDVCAALVGVQRLHDVYLLRGRLCIV